MDIFTAIGLFSNESGKSGRNGKSGKYIFRKKWAQWVKKNKRTKEGINVQGGGFFKINKHTGPNKVRTDGNYVYYAPESNY